MEVLLWLADTRCTYNTRLSKFRVDLTLTSTSPSLYLQLIGTAAVHDQCTTVGPKLTSPIITLPPGGLSTWKPPANRYSDDNFTVGEIWQDPGSDLLVDIAEGIAQLDVKDLACPTWSVGTTSANGTVTTTIGSPWLPLIVVPTEVFSLDPTWATICTAMFRLQFWSTTVGLFDPPIALTPASLLAPTPPTRPTSTPVPTPADPTTFPVRATSYSEAAKPASLPNDPLAPPARTGDPSKASSIQSPANDSANPAPLPQQSAISPNQNGHPPLDPSSNTKAISVSVLAGDPADPPADPPSKSKVPLFSTLAGDPPVDPPADPPAESKVPSVPPVAGDPPAKSITPSSTTANTPLDNSQKPTDPKVPSISVSTPGGDWQAQTQGLGAIIYNAFERSEPKSDAASTKALLPQSIFTIDTQVFTVRSTRFEVNNVAISPGGGVHTIDNMAIGLDQSGVLVIGSSTIVLANQNPTTVVTAAGQTFTPNPSAFSVAGKVVSKDGSAIAVDGTIISLGPSGALVIGSTTIPLTDPSPTLFATKPFTVAGQVFTPNPSVFSIADTIISANGPAVTIGGTKISLGQSGALEIGSSTIFLPPFSEVPSTPDRVYTAAGQTFTPNPSAFAIADTTVSAGGVAATIDGTIISLQSSGTLLIGTSTIPLLSAQSPSNINLEAGGAALSVGTGRFTLPTTTGGIANGSFGIQAFTGGQCKGLESSPLALLCGVCGTLMLLM